MKVVAKCLSLSYNAPTVKTVKTLLLPSVSHHVWMIHRRTQSWHFSIWSNHIRQHPPCCAVRRKCLKLHANSNSSYTHSLLELWFITYQNIMRLSNCEPGIYSLRKRESKRKYFLSKLAWCCAVRCNIKEIETRWDIRAESVCMFVTWSTRSEVRERVINHSPNKVSP